MNRLLLPTAFLLLAFGFWVSPEFKTIAAGIAIFLFGMFALEEGFRMFGGGTMDRLLRKSTDRVWKSLAFGVISTSLVQSSSLISVLTISFLSAGLISLVAGMGIIFGANLGTTTGAWIIAGFGLKVDIAAYALPLLVFGVLLMFQRAKPLKGVGYALAGIGFLFLGIDYMKQGFETFKDAIDLTRFMLPGVIGLLAFTAIGIVATVIMQSSHATLVLILTALSAGQIHYDNALALAIGSNIGTTITAVIGSLGANVDGRRLALAHLIFNLATATVALVLIGPFILAVDWFSAGIGIAHDDLTLKFALFHSLFNLVGIALMLPLLHPLARLLQRWLKEKAVTIHQPKFLHASAIEFPDSAIEAAHNEAIRIFDVAQRIITRGLSLNPAAILGKGDINEVVTRSREIVREDIDDRYRLRIKPLYGAMVEFISQAQLNADPPRLERLHALRQACADLVEALKAVKHLQKNLLTWIASDNRYMRAQYDQIRILISRVLREIGELRADPRAFTVLSLDSTKLLLEKSDIVTTGVLDRLIRKRRITPEMATSLINDYGYCRTACENLIAMAKVLFAEQDLALRAAEQSVALDAGEIKRIANDKGNPTEK
ncbi:MAG: Na/Pi cotransporter family protein [Thiotrichales bacterium]